MLPSDKVIELRGLIEKILSPLVDNDYLLFELPRHANLGDTLIWQGELDFLKTLSYKCKFSTGYLKSIFIAKEFIQPNTLLLFQGGGNFGDVWEGPNDFRKAVLRMYPNQPSIIFPQTIYYNKIENLKEDAAFYANYPNVTICARDRRSLSILQEYFPMNPSFLVPDMAFFMDIERLKRTRNPKGAVYIRRNDRELNIENNYHIVPDYADTIDWTFLENSRSYSFQDDIEKWASLIDNKFGGNWRCRCLDLYWNRFLRQLNVKTAISVIDKYEEIYATRMHAAILGVILGKTAVTLFDNSYGKCSSFYHTWLSDIDSFNIVENE